MNVSKADLRRSVQRALEVQNELLRSLHSAVHPIAAAVTEADERCRTLNLLLEGLEDDSLSSVKTDGIGFGSSMTLRNLDLDTVSVHRIMSGDALDLDAGHMSIDSALGSALLGRKAGGAITVETPGGRRRLRIEQIGTLFDFLDECSTDKGVGRGVKKAAPARQSRRASVAEARR